MQQIIIPITFYEPIKNLTLEQKGSLFEAIFRYVAKGIEPEQTSDINVHFQFFKSQNIPEPKKKKGIVNEIEKGVYPKFLAVYSDWHNEKVGATIKMTGAQGEAMKRIIKYLLENSKERSEEGALLAWEYILVNWNKIDNEYQKKIKLNEIDYNLPNILNQLKNGNSKKTNSHSENGREEARELLSSIITGKNEQKQQ